MQDAGNHAVTDYSGSVTLTLLGGNGNPVLTGGGATPTVSGAATFPGLSVNKMALDYQIAASAPYGSGTLAGTSAIFKITNRTPTLTSMSPYKLAPGQPAFTLTLNGGDFMNGATVYFNNVAMPTTFISSIQLTAAIPAASVAAAGTFPVVVKNPPIVLADSSPLTFTVATPSVVYVNTAWSNTGSYPPGASVNVGAADPHYIGYDAFATVQAGVNAVASGGSVYVLAGTYIEEVTVPNPMLLHGAGIDTTVLIGPKTGASPNTLTLASSGVTVEGFTITRDGNNVTDWNLPTLKSQGVLFGQGKTGNTLRYCKLTGNRNAVYINNAQGNTVRNNVIDFNRTGVHFNNNVTGTVVRENVITNNWTMGILFNADTASLTTSGVTITDNTIAGNWYGQVQCRWANSTAILDLSGNWLGTTSPTTSASNSGEPSYDAGLTAIPVVYGGTGANPGTSATVGGLSVARVDYTPWLNSGTDTEPGTIGFQGDFSYLNAGAASPQSGATPRITEAIGLLTSPGTVNLTAGTFTENVVVNKPLTLMGAGELATTIVPALSAPNPCSNSSLCGGAASNIILVQADNVTIQQMTLDGDNPTLTSGIDVGGADLDARNGIIILTSAPGTFTTG